MIHIQRVNPETGAISEVITLDVTLNANLSHTMTVTDFPVEDGSRISDHAQQQPHTVTFQAMVSATPLRFISFSPVVTDARIKSAFEIMEELQTNKELVRIVADLKTYDNMMLTQLNAPRRQDTKHAFMFTAVFREVRIVSSQIVTLPPEEEVQQTATQPEEGGKVAPKPTESEAETEKASLLYRTLQGVGVIE